MGSVKADVRELEKLRDRLDALEKSKEKDKFCEDCAKEMAARLLKLVIDRTPVGKYPEGSGKTGGKLRRGWTAGKSIGARAFAKGCKVYKNGDNYTIVVATQATKYTSTRGGG